MKRTKEKRIHFLRRHQRVRTRVKGTEAVPRLSVFRSNKHLYEQLIDDERRHTVAAASDREIKKGSQSKRTSATHLNKEAEPARYEEVGLLIAEKAKQMQIIKVIFDRGGYKYHGAVRALAEGARKGGLMF